MSARKTIAKWVGGAAVIALGAGAAVAADDTQRPDVVETVFNCRAIADPEARLACYDSAVAELASAEQRRDILFADREQVKKTKKGLFGLDVSKLNIFSNDGNDAVDEITTKIVGVRQIDRKWLLVLEDGARWMQIDSKQLPRFPKAGMEIKIRSAALGSYLANIDGMNAIRVKRTN